MRPHYESKMNAIGVRILQMSAAAIITLVCLSESSASSSDQSVELLERVEIPLPAWVSQQDRARPGTLETVAPSKTKRTIFGQLINAMLNGNWSTAGSLAQKIDYQIVRFKESSKSIVVANDNSGEGLHPTLVVNTAPKLNVIVGAPHAAFETGTAEQAALLVSLAGSRAAVISGAHRCASRTFVGCDGKTRVCGAREAYRTSDVAHNPTTLFHQAHELMAESWPNAVVVSLHGMREDNDGIRTSIILSHGYKSDDVSKRSYATKLRLELGKTYTSPGAVVSCDLPEDRTYRARPLCGYTNVQGRFVNGDSDVCKTSQIKGTNRFVHIEQDWMILRPFSRAWAGENSNLVIRTFLDAFTKVMPEVTQ